MLGRLRCVPEGFFFFLTWSNWLKVEQKAGLFPCVVLGLCGVVKEILVKM
jgi:apolipoprotein N-acyltransferase